MKPAFLLLLWLFLAVPLSAQRYPVVQVPGAPHGIYTMMQDSQSRIWMSTIDDVFCFDGVRFYSLRQFGFPKEITNGFAEDGNGGVWIGTLGADYQGGTGQGGLYRYQSGRVEKIFSGDVLSVASIAPAVMLASFGTEADGRPTYGDLYRFDRTGEKWNATRLLEKRVHHITVDAQVNALFPCPGGWCESSRQAILDWRPGAKLALTEHPGDPLVERVLRDRFGCLWFRAEAVGSYQCPGAPLTTISNSILAYDASAHLEETADGSIFMLVRMTLGRPGDFHTNYPRSGLPSGLDTAIVGRDGTIWMGTESGLYRFMYPFRLEYWTQDHGLEETYSLIKLGGQVFATNGYTGLRTLSQDRRTWTLLPGTSQLQGMSALMAGPAGTLFTAGGGGVAQLRLDGTVIARSSDVGTAFAKTADGSVWMGSGLPNSGIHRVSRNGLRLQLTPENVPVDTTPTLSYDRDRDTLWACDGKELVFRRAGSWSRLGAQQGLLDSKCRTVLAHPNGDVWMGYENSWLALIRNPFSAQPTVRNFRVQSDQPVANSGNAFLAADRRGWIWRGSDGVYVATSEAAEAGDWVRLGLDDGLPSSAANANSFFSDPDGSVWFASETNVVHFSPPSDFATDFSAPQVFVAGFSFGTGQPMLADTVASLPHGSDFTVHIGSLQFARRSNLHLRYRLLPEQTSWISPPAFDLHLGKLPSGSHTLEVQAQLGSGPWSATSAKSFAIARPFWLTWPVLVGVLAIGGVAAAGGRFWTKRQAQRNAVAFPQLAEWRLAALHPEVSVLAGTLLDSRFEVGDIVARGGFATIARGRDLQRDNCPCAIKIFRREIDQEWMARRFQQEVLALEKIRHPNVVQIYGHGTIPLGSQYLVMEFIEGRTLREELVREKLAPPQAASYLLQTGSALTEIHRHGICHRDLKPENLMIRDAAPVGADLVLIDFSIAIVKDPDVTLHGLSRAAGTFYYMAPEQSIGYADSSTDLYSLAKIVIEMLTGRRLSALLPDASMDLPERVRDLLAGLSLKLSHSTIEMIGSALEFDPARRPKHASDFVAQIAKDLSAV